MTFSHLEEKQIEREEIFEGHIVHLVRDRVLLPDGREATREVCIHGGAVAVLPLLPSGEVLVERQFRYAHGRVLLEIPAGKLEKGEGADPLSAAKRELREETGAVAKKYTDLGVLIPTPAVLNEKIHLYMAEDITFVDQSLDEDEFLNVEMVPFEKLVEDVMAGTITDAKTVATTLKVKVLLGL